MVSEAMRSGFAASGPRRSVHEVRCSSGPSPSVLACVIRGAARQALVALAICRQFDYAECVCRGPAAVFVLVLGLIQDCGFMSSDPASSKPGKEDVTAQAGRPEDAVETPQVSTGPDESAVPVAPQFQAGSAESGATDGIGPSAATAEKSAADVSSSEASAAQEPEPGPLQEHLADPTDESATPVGAEQPGKSVGIGAEQTDQESLTAAPAATESTQVSRIRERLISQQTAEETDRAVGSVDLAEVEGSLPSPVRTGPIDLPPETRLDESLEAEIAVAMSQSEGNEPAATQVADESADAPATIEPSTAEVHQGQKLKGTVQQIHADNVFIDVGLRQSAMVSLRQFESGKHPSVGQQLEVIVVREDPDEGLIHVNMPRGRSRLSGKWDEISVGQVVDSLVKGANKGGLEVTVGGLRAFLPASQVDLGYVSSLESWVGQRLRVQITEVNQKKRNLVVSRRALLQAERAEGEKDFWKDTEVGQTFTGTVKTIKDYGAFVDLGAIDGFLHIGEISWSRIRHANEVLQEGQQVDVKVLSLDPDKKRVGLGMRQLTQNPWVGAEDKWAIGRTVSGRVTRTADYGAFVELEPGVEGMAHISELAWRRVRSVSDVLQVDQVADFKVLEIDRKRKRIALSLKALQDKPESPQSESTSSESASDDVPRRKRTGPLKGGTGQAESTGGLFGNPSDFS